MDHPMSEVIRWIDGTLKPRACTSVEFIYDDMDSQSGRSLPIIYQPFDIGDRGHWEGRGALFDFLHSTRGEGRRLLDFGPGDGWPSLIVAPYAREVVGVDGSLNLINVCRENSRRLGIRNTAFIHYEPGHPLPFPDEGFDGVMAASSLEQTPAPKAVLMELFRVLRSGGCLRISYEALNRYRGGEECGVWLYGLTDASSRLMIYDRKIDEEYTVQYGLTISMTISEVQGVLGGSHPKFDMITVERLEGVLPAIEDAMVCELTHPSGRTLASWMEEVGFSEVHPTHDGSTFAGRLFDTLPKDERPEDMEGLDEMLRPLVGVVVEMAAPLEEDPMITAVK